MARKKKTANVTLVRNAILGGIALIVIVILGYAILYSVGVLDPNKGELYFTIPDREVKNDPIEVIEFFSYACPRCKELDGLLKSWERSLPDDVEFSKIHVAHSVQTTNLARTHVALGQRNIVAQNNDRIFTEVEKRPQTFATLDSTSEFFDGHGIEKEQFELIAQSERVQSVLDTQEQTVREYGIVAVPTFVIANKYIVPSKTTQQETVRALRQVIEMVRSGELPVQEETTSTEEETVGDPTEGSDSNSDDEQQAEGGNEDSN